MSAPIILPLSFEPISAQFTTSSYTIPANQYALCEPLLGWNTVNGSAIFQSGSYNLYNFTNTAGAELHIPSMSGWTRVQVASATTAVKGLSYKYNTGTGFIETRVVANTTSSGVTVDVGFQDGNPVTIFGGSAGGSPALTLPSNFAFAGLFATRNPPGGSINMSVTVINYTPRSLYLSAGVTIAGGPWIVSLYRKIT